MKGQENTLEHLLAARSQLAGPIVNVDEPTRELVVFQLGEGWFALPGGSVREILPCGTIFPLPGLPVTVAGVILLRGEIASVVRIHGVLGAAEMPVSRHSAILMGVGGEIESGVLVDRVVDVLTLAVSKVGPQPATLADHLRPLVAGEFTLRDHLVTLLNLDRLFQTILAVRG